MTNMEKSGGKKYVFYEWREAFSDDDDDMTHSQKLTVDLDHKRSSTFLRKQLFLCNIVIIPTTLYCINQINLTRKISLKTDTTFKKE